MRRGRETCLHPKADQVSHRPLFRRCEEMQ